MLMFEGMLKVYVGHAAIFNNLDWKKCYFYKFYYFSDHVYFKLPWFRLRAVAESAEARNIDSYI